MHQDTLQVQNAFKTGYTIYGNTDQIAKYSFCGCEVFSSTVVIPRVNGVIICFGSKFLIPRINHTCKYLN